MPSLQDRLTVAAISLNIAWGDVDENIFATAAAIEALPNIPDVIVEILRVLGLRSFVMALY